MLTFTTTILLICLAAFASAARGTPPDPQADSGWLDQFLPPPDCKDAVDPGAHERLRAFAQTDAFGVPQMRGALAAMLDASPSRRRYPAREALRAAGPRAEPALLECLRDRRYQPPADPSHPDSPHPWDFACERLARMGSAPLVRILADADRDGVIPPKRKRDAALWIAAVGTAESVAPTLAALNDPEPYVRSYARTGIAWALMDGHLGPEMRAAVFDPLLESALGPPSHLTNADEVRLLLRVDRGRALAALMNDRVLSAEHPRLDDVLAAFTFPPALHVLGPGERYDLVAAPPQRLWALWRSEEARGLSPRKGSCAAAVLLALARSDPDATRPVADDLFNRAGPLSGAAITALAIIENFPDGTETLDLWMAASPGVAPPRPLLHVHAVERCFGYQVLGGIPHFLESYKEWQLGPEGLRALGLPTCADAVETVSAVYFGPAGPPADMAERERILFSHDETDREERVLAGCERTLEDARDQAARSIFVYMRQHRDIFSTLKPRPAVTRP